MNVDDCHRPTAADGTAVISAVAVTLADGTVLPDCRRDLLSIGDLWGRGWSVFPVKPRSKVPALPWEAYQRRVPSFRDIEAWFTVPGFNIGVVTGAVSGIFVVDVDSGEALEWATCNLPPCDLRVRTANGVHFYYPYSGDRPIRNKTRVRVAGRTLDIDIRGDGGFVVGPGSHHPSGHVYCREGDGWRSS